MTAARGDEIEAERRTAWVALVEASLGLANAVSGGAADASMKAAEGALRSATAPFARAHRAVVDHLRPPGPRRTPRCARTAPEAVEDLEQAHGAAWTTLVKAAFALRNSVSNHGTADRPDGIRELEAALSAAAICHADAQQAIVDRLRTRPRGVRRRK